MLRPLPLVRRHARRRSAFTLLEVLVVVAILVVLASVAGIYVFRSYEDAKKDTARTQIRTIENACKQFKLKYSMYPTQLTDLVQPPAIDGAQTPTPFLEGGMQGISPPWPNVQYQYQPPQGDTSQGGEVRPWIGVQAPDGELIQNFARQ